MNRRRDEPDEVLCTENDKLYSSGKNLNKEDCILI